MSIALALARTPTQRDVIRFQIETLAAEQSVILIDLSLLIGRNIERSAPLLLPANAVLVVPRSIEELTAQIAKSGAELFVEALPSCQIRTQIIQICRSQSITILRHAIGNVPPIPKPTLASLLVERAPITPLQWSRRIESLAGRLGTATGCGVDIFISAGDSSLESEAAKHASHIISGRSFDCDSYRNLSTLEGLPEAFAVFVDSGGPLHPDYKLLGVRARTSVQSYFGDLKLFLEETERVTKIPVLIARHPRMAHVSYADLLPGFAVFDSMTPELVQQSKFVLDGGSTATSFSVLGNKPIRYIAPGSKPGSHQSRAALAFAASLGQIVHHSMDSFRHSLAEIEHVPSQNYHTYRRLYLYSDNSSQLSFGEEVLQIAKSL